jgi:hypothetical protein
MEEVRTVLKMDKLASSNRDSRTANPLGVDATVSRVSNNSDSRSSVIPAR